MSLHTRKPCAIGVLSPHMIAESIRPLERVAQSRQWTQADYEKQSCGSVALRDGKVPRSTVVRCCSAKISHTRHDDWLGSFSLTLVLLCPIHLQWRLLFYDEGTRTGEFLCGCTGETPLGCRQASVHACDEPRSDKFRHIHGVTGRAQWISIGARRQVSQGLMQHYE